MHQIVRAGAAAEVLVAYRFVEAGRRPAWPLVTGPYDLLVDAGDAVWRVQVKQANQDQDKPNRWRVTLQKRKGPPLVTEFDYLTVVIDPERIYVIPVSSLTCAHDPMRCIAAVDIGTVDGRFMPYLNNFGLGTGVRPAPIPSLLRIRPELKRTVHFVRKRHGNQRKPHRRVTAGEAGEIRRLAATDTMTPQELARQFNISTPTVYQIVNKAGRFARL